VSHTMAFRVLWALECRQRRLECGVLFGFDRTDGPQELLAATFNTSIKAAPTNGLQRCCRMIVAGRHTLQPSSLGVRLYGSSVMRFGHVAVFLHVMRFHQLASESGVTRIEHALQQYDTSAQPTFEITQSNAGAEPEAATVARPYWDAMTGPCGISANTRSDTAMVLLRSACPPERR
jgi:hypothetical protein